MKLLTIVVPSYNVEKYIEDTINSIIKCKRLNEIEIIIVNDGSTDKTGILAESFSQLYKDSILVVNKENGGHGSTINTGLSIASGKYFIVIDGDDWVDSKILDEFVDFIRDQTSDLIITGHFKNYIVTGIEETYGYKEKRGFKADVKYLLDNNYRIPMTDTCYKTKLLRDMKLTIQENTFYVDEEFCGIPFRKVETIAFFSKGFYHYRIGDINQSISDINIVKRIDHKQRVFSRIMNIVRDEKMNSCNCEYIRRKMVGVANSILCTYYVYFPNKKEGREKGDVFLQKLTDDYPEIAQKCLKIGGFFRLMNFLHLGSKTWKRYQNIKYFFSERTR